LLQPGDLVPSELELVEALKIGRQTLRQALAKLVDEGLLERFPGKGTFVCDNSAQRDFYLDRSFSQQMTDLGKKTWSKVLCQEMGTIDDNAPSMLQVKMGAPCLYLTRLRYAEKTPIGYQEAITLTEFCRDLVTHDFSHDSLYRILSEEYKLEISEISHVVNALNATEDIARLLEIEPGAPVLLEKSVTFLINGDPIEATSSYFRADKHQYSVRFKYLGSKNGAA
jgi:GntR family transcriptional regulator